MKSLTKILLFIASVFIIGCSQQEKREVVVYTALDQQFSEPILDEFEKRTGIRVLAVYDTEAVKTVGLVNRLLAERQRPVCDVFWNNEIVRTIQLKREGLLQPYDSPSADGMPSEFKDSEHYWTGFAARARVIMVNANQLPDPSQYPRSIRDLTDQKWKARAGFAKPLFGTTSTHAAYLWSEWGEQQSIDFWQDALANSIMYAGNAQARDAAANGEIAWCLTDTDDAYGALLDGEPVEMYYPDSGAGDMGAVLIPNTLGLVANCPHPEEAKALINYLLSAEVEAALAKSRSAQVPLRPGVPGPEGIPALADVKVAAIDWEAVADALPESQLALTKLIGEAGR